MGKESWGGNRMGSTLLLTRFALGSQKGAYWSRVKKPPSLFRSQPLPSSQDRASLAKVIGLGEAFTCASRSSRGEKSWGL